MKRTVLIAGALIAAIGGSLVGAGSASAGQEPTTAELTITYNVYDNVDDANAIANALGGELFLDDAGSPGLNVSSLCTDTVSSTGPGSNGFKQVRCTVDIGESYIIGVGNLPATHYVQHMSCREFRPRQAIDNSSAFVTIETPNDVRCDIEIEPNPTLHLDKVITGGSLTPADFTLEVYKDGALVANLTDPSADTCSEFDLDDTKCAAVQLAAGDYVLGEMTENGYLATNVTCVSVFIQDEEKFSDALGGFTHSVEGEGTLCTVTNTYFTRTISADIVVENSNGGTATAADFLIEVFQDGALVASGVDPEPGTGNASFEATLPIGDYSFGVSGPDGYTTNVVVTVIDDPTAIINDPSANFSLNISQIAAATMTAVDPTTTTTTTTTIAPTTIATTTTTLPAVVLPATGPDSSSTLLLWALALMLVGSGTVLITRRS